MAWYVSHLAKEQVRTSSAGEYWRAVRTIVQQQVPALDNAVGTYILDVVCPRSDFFEPVCRTFFYPCCMQDGLSNEFFS